MKKIIIGLVGLLILLIGIFIYVKINDNNSIDAFNIAVENHRAGTEQLLTENTELKKQLTIYESTIRELEQRSVELGNTLAEAERYNEESARIIEDSIITTEAIKEIDTEFKNTIADSLSIIGELEEYDFAE